MLKKPIAITEKVRDFANSLVPNAPLIEVPVRAEKNATTSNCFPNVKAKIAVGGGTIQYGWTIREEAGLLLQAEFHGNWVSPDGEVIDVTPKEDKSQCILFFEDPDVRFRGIPIANRWKSLTDDSRVDEYIRLQQQIDNYRIERRKGQLPEEKEVLAKFIAFDLLLGYELGIEGADSARKGLALKRKLGLEITNQDMLIERALSGSDAKPS